MPQARIYHNPRCSKSRAALALLQTRLPQARIVEYLKTPPTREELRALLAQLGLRAEELVRKGEPLFKERYAGRTLTEDQWIEAMLADPILIERPIVVVGERALLGRPPERVQELLD